MKLATYCRVSMAALFLMMESCIYKEIPGPDLVALACADSDLSVVLVSKTDATTCKSVDGQLEVIGSNGTPPYDYKIGDGIYQTNPVFTNLGPGTYTVAAKDAQGCWRKMDVAIAATNSTLAATYTTSPDTQCQAPSNGGIVVTPTGGVLPYQTKLDDGVFGPATTFNALESGAHTVIVKDGEDCEFTLHITVVRADTGVSYSAQIFPIFTASCNFSSCHGAGATGRDWTDFTTVQAKAGNIKTRTGNRTMPIGIGPSLTDAQIQLIACWVDDGAKDN